MLSWWKGRKECHRQSEHLQVGFRKSNDFVIGSSRARNDSLEILKNRPLAPTLERKLAAVPSCVWPEFALHSHPRLT